MFTPFEDVLFIQRKKKKKNLIYINEVIRNSFSCCVCALTVTTVTAVTAVLTCFYFTVSALF